MHTQLLKFIPVLPENKQISVSNADNVGMYYSLQLKNISSI